jgi:hypothetical protein
MNHSNYIKDLRQSASIQKDHYMKVSFTVVPDAHDTFRLGQSQVSKDNLAEYNLTFEVFSDNSGLTTMISEDDFGVLELYQLETVEYENMVSFVSYYKNESTGLTVARGIEVGYHSEFNRSFVQYFYRVFNETYTYVDNSLGVFYNHELGTMLWHKTSNDLMVKSTWDVSLIEAFSDHSLVNQYFARF